MSAFVVDFMYMLSPLDLSCRPRTHQANPTLLIFGPTHEANYRHRLPRAQKQPSADQITRFEWLTSRVPADHSAQSPRTLNGGGALAVLAFGFCSVDFSPETLPALHIKYETQPQCFFFCIGPSLPFNSVTHTILGQSPWRS
jgi:hypothetical protein